MFQHQFQKNGGIKPSDGDDRYKLLKQKAETLQLKFSLQE